ncbi:MAG: class A beta-lactamase-related serine hydrolase [Oscillospiraceae bacterium]|nr:class A beta-lactamase-related serine hydrolase [Oscillospiraceae bacterium]
MKKLLSLLLALSMLSGFAVFAEEESSGIIDEAALNAWMDAYVAEHNLTGGGQDFSVGFCYTGTGDFWYYNADVFMYSASMYKVPVSMLMAEKEVAGEVTPGTVIQGTTLEYLESTALTHSNNDSGHAMVDYLGGTYSGKCSDMTIRYTDLAEDYFPQDFYDYSYYSARYMTQVMKTLYDGQAENAFPHVIDYLLPAQPGAYFKISLSQYDVAQKYGAFEEKTGAQNNHCTAIIYTPTPIIVTVMTRNVGDYQRRISEVGAYLAEYALSLDEKWEELKNAPPAPTESLSEETEAVPAEAEPNGEQAETRTETTPVPTAAQEATAAETGHSGAAGIRNKLVTVLGIGLFLVLLVIAVLILAEKEKAEKKAEETRKKAAAAKDAEKETSGYRPRH